MNTVLRINNKLQLPSESTIKTDLINKLSGLRNQIKKTDQSATHTRFGVTTYDLLELSKEYLNTIKDIFTKYISLPPCEKVDNNSIKCKELKFEYYSIILLKILIIL